MSLNFAALLRREALCHISNSVGRNSEGVFLGLMTYPGPKGPRGTTACQETDGHREGVEDEPSGDPRDRENT